MIEERNYRLKKKKKCYISVKEIDENNDKQKTKLIKKIKIKTGQIFYKQN